MTSGVIYIAFGDRYVAEATHSAASLKSTTNIPATLFTDFDVNNSVFENVVVVDPKHKRAKIDFISESPYDKTLYLDSDTEIARDVSDIFAVLDRFDMAATHDLSRKSSRWSKKIPEYDAIPYSFPEYNGGVIGYRRSRATEEMFSLWKEYFYRYRTVTNGQDQASFRISLWQSDVSIHTLPIEYNVRSRANRNKIDKRARTPQDESILKPRIYHWHGLNKPGFLSKFRPETRPFYY